MTAQAPDLVTVDDVEYAIAGVYGEGLFDPERHRLKPQMISTACWRGYLCRYAVQSNRLTLTELFVGAGTKLAGRELGPGDEFLGGVLAADDGIVGRGLVLRSLSVALDFSGGLLLGTGFVRSTYVHMGYHPAWRFERVLEVLAHGGAVTEVHDRSSEMADLRQRIQEGEVSDPDGPRGGRAWVERTFKLDYSRSLPQ